MNKAYKFRLYPNTDQANLIDRTIGCTRFIYNKMLSDKIAHYQETHLKLNNTPAQYKNEFEWLKEVDSLALANAQMNLQTAYNNFFRDPKVGFPKFKSKKKSKLSYTTNNQNGTIAASDKHIKLPKLKEVRCKFHRQIPLTHVIKSATITKTPTGKYYISILTEYDTQVQPKAIETVVGLDYAQKELFVSSDGQHGNYPKFYREAQQKLAKEQRILSKRKYGSKRYLQQKLKVAKIHEHIANQRKDFLHKLSTDLCNKYDLICIEDLNMQALSQCLNLAKNLLDNSWGTFTTYLTYKQIDRGGLLQKIGKFYPSSKTCGICGAINTELKLSDREWTCDCGAHHNRDLNAANNIKAEGIRLALA